MITWLKGMCFFVIGSALLTVAFGVLLGAVIGAVMWLI